MKYKIGDKVKYDGGDWWFYGTVSAIFEHPICPCYRLSVERMEKKSCKFSITQFEFEIEPDVVVDDSNKEKRKWENLEVTYLKKWYGVLNNNDLAKVLKRTPQAIEEKWQQIQEEPEEELRTVPEVKKTLPEVKKPLPEIKKPLPEPKIVQKIEPVIRKKPGPKPKMKFGPKPEPRKYVSAEKRPKLKKGEAWDNYYERYRRGEKTNIIYNWVATNRREYKSGKLSEAKLEKLIEINFPFESPIRKK